MKARLLTGKYYRRENGRIVKYSAGDILTIFPAEARRLDVREEILVANEKKPMVRTKKAATMVSETSEEKLPESEKVVDDNKSII